MVKSVVRIALFIATFGVAANSIAQNPHPQIHLWPGGAPGYESRKDEPEQAKDWWVKNIHNPSITVFLPSKEKATGVGVVICPGGGHTQLVYNSEGQDAAEYFNSIGVAAFVLKYRLFREPNSVYTLDKEIKQDAYRAMRLVRSRANEWGVNPSKLGIMGFSAGGEVVALVAYGSGKGDPAAADPIDRLDGKPNFQVLIYPGPLGVPDVVGSDAPPAFLLAANEDVCCSPPIVKLLQKYREAKVPVEAHIYGQGAHAFNMGKRSTYRSLKTWSQRLTDWLTDGGILVPPPAPVGAFANHGDVGVPKNTGSASYDSVSKTYTLRGSGYNIWFERDEFHFLYNHLKGDFKLTANCDFVGTGTDPHRKVGWMVRDSLGGGDVHISAVSHGDGLTVLQWRLKKGMAMRDPEDEIRATGKKYSVIQLERKGNVFTMRVAKAEGQPFETVGSQAMENLPNEVFAGLFICAHNEDLIEEAKVWNVRIE